LIDDIVEIAGEAYDQDSTAAARVGVDTRFGVSGCLLPTKYDRRNIEAEAIDTGALTIRALYCFAFATATDSVAAGRASIQRHRVDRA